MLTTSTSLKPRDFDGRNNKFAAIGGKDVLLLGVTRDYTRFRFMEVVSRKHIILFNINEEYFVDYDNNRIEVNSSQRKSLETVQ